MMRRLLPLLLLSACTGPETVATDEAALTAAAETTLLSRRGEWIYSATGVDLGSGWQHGGWDGVTGTGPLGYGETYVNPIPYGSDPTRKPTTVYFRRAFHIEDPAYVAALRLEAMYDDGFVAWINGVEVARASMPSGTVTYSTLASGHEANNRYDSFDASEARDLLRRGENNLLIEVHQQSPSSSDLVFDAALFAELATPTRSIARGSVWRFWDRGGDLGTTWRNINYLHGDWSSGAGPLGYGESYLATLVGYGPSSSSKYLTTYFRHEFAVDDPAAITRITGELMFDDGVVVYLNSHEIARASMPAGTVTASTRAFGHEAQNAYQSFDWSQYRELLQDGINVIAVEVHQEAASSSDLVFDLALTLEEAPPPPEDGIARGSMWRYWDRGGDLGTTWRGAYDDAAWATGAGPLGYGESYLATTVSYGTSSTSKHLTTYFRRQFSVDDPATVGTITGELMYDDGAVVYLNGQEIGRASMPTGTITASTRALGHEAAGYQAFDWSAHRGKLVAGVNTLAVEVHQEAASSSDLVFDASLTLVAGEPAPYVIQPRSSWRYFDQSQFPGWQHPALMDHDWASGPGPLGYGESYIATTTLRREATTYFRKPFFVADRSAVTGLIAEVMYDDGVVIWLNNLEIARRSMPAGDYTHETFASGHEANGYETIDLSAHRGLLVSGSNLLAIEVHQASLSSSDLVFDLGLRVRGGPTGDHDGDRLSDVDEDQRGTDPANPDSDGDGLSDGDEVLGTRGGLDLPALGVSPLRKDILIEYDWVDDSLDCNGVFHTHRPHPAMLERVTDMFRNAPVANPDGSTGITLIHDHGQGAPFTGGNRISDADGRVSGIDNEFYAHKAANFASNRSGYFHYFLMPHDTGTGGVGELVGDDVLFWTRCDLRDDFYPASVVMHELGHNLGLHHGGISDAVNNKPNYNSVMNYRYVRGIDTNCDGDSDWPPVLAYSPGVNPPLDEVSLDESAGICNGVALDWNQNGTIDGARVQYDINFDGGLRLLLDRADWPNLVYDFSPAAAGYVVPEVITCDFD